MIFAIVGPTASHKSELAENLANHFDAEVINCDAYQVYIELNKGTAKPDRDFLKSHNNYHLFDFIHLDQTFDVATFQKLGRELLEKYKNRNVVLVGGTGFYLKALLYDFKFEEEEIMDPNYLSSESNENLYHKLMAIDPIDAKKIGINNRKRLIRALYVYDVHKKTKTELNDNGKDRILYDNLVILGIDKERNKLYEDINSRVDLMVKNGLIEEVKEIQKKFPKPIQSLQAIGYKEFYLGLKDEDAIELIKKNTRHYAKRQMTYFKNQFNNILWFNSGEEAYNYAIKKY